MINSIERSPVTSSNIHSIGYDAATRTLAIQFRNGGVYHYADVSPDEHQALMQSESKTRHFQAKIRDAKTCQKVI